MLSLEQHINTSPSNTMMTLKATVVTPWTFDRSVTVDQDTTDTSSSSAGDDSVHNNSTHPPKVVSFTPTSNNCKFKDRKFVTRSQLHLPEGKRITALQSEEPLMDPSMSLLSKITLHSFFISSQLYVDCRKLTLKKPRKF